MRLLACLLLVLPVVALAAPVPTHLTPKDPPLYFPTKVGTKWVYVVDSGEHTETITRVTEEGGVKLVRVCEVSHDGRLYHGEEVAVSGAGLTRVSYVGKMLDTPLRLLKIPSKPGDRWEYRTSGGGLDENIQGTATFRGVEQVDVPAGTFRAVRVEYDYTSGRYRERWTSWFAPGVGLVKMAWRGKTWQVLKSFTPGKD